MTPIPSLSDVTRSTAQQSWWVCCTAAGDDAAMESFFGLLQNNVLDRRQWAAREELRVAIVTWIERTHHRRRRQKGLGRLTPIEYETIMTTSVIPTA